MARASTHGQPAAPAAEGDWQHVNAWRKARRAEIRERRLALSPAQRRDLQARVLGHVEAGFPELAGATVAFYWPFRGEVDVQPLLKRQAARGGRTALPVVVQRNAPVEFWAWQPGMRMEPGIWNIPVPAERRPAAPAVCLVPLVGFDAACYRLGNGGGYYDRTLATLAPRPLTLGIGYELGRLETIHPQPHDIALDGIVTEAGVHWPAAEPDAPGNSSPVCYADEAAPEYFGYLSRDETHAVLAGIRAAEAAALHGADALGAALPGEAAATLQALAREQARCWGLLVRLQAQLGAGAPPPASPDAAATLTLAQLAAALDALAAQLAAALPRLRDEAMHSALAALPALHTRAAEHCRALDSAGT